jgi:hypothetical protein
MSGRDLDAAIFPYARMEKAEQGTRHNGRRSEGKETR